MTDAVVYVVDDDAAMRSSMRRLIGSVGLEVKAFASASAFLDAFDPGAPSCAVVDVRMPQMSGVELQRELIDRGHEIPLIVVTAFADVPMAVGVMKAGAVDLIEKPFRSQHLLDRIQHALARDEASRSRRAERDRIDGRLDRLTPREHEVMELVVAGCTSRQIAERLGLSPKTVHVHRAEVMGKMEAGSVAELASMVVAARAATN